MDLPLLPDPQSDQCPHAAFDALAAWAGQAGAALEPLYEVHKAFVLACRVLHAEETAVALLDPGAGKTRRAYVWAYARSWHDAVPGVVYEFCLGRGAQYPNPSWLVTRAAAVADGRERCSPTAMAATTACSIPASMPTASAQHASPMHAASSMNWRAPARARSAMRRSVTMRGSMRSRPSSRQCDDERQAQRQQLAKPLWAKLKQWLDLERHLVVDGSTVARAIDHTLDHWGALTHYLKDGAVAIDSNHLERQTNLWAMDRRPWLFAGSELAGQRTAIVMSRCSRRGSTGMTPGPTCATSWRDCRLSSIAGSTNCSVLGLLHSKARSDRTWAD